MARCWHLEGSPAHGALVAPDHPAGDCRLAEVVTYEGLLLSALQEVLRLHGHMSGQQGLHDTGWREVMVRGHLNSWLLSMLAWLRVQSYLNCEMS